ncbi:MAG: redoxin domain-containing protein [Bryobacteraceae bacterium]|jgi:peroxiredoxin/outer membrane lipoprotein-sorting protein
MLRLTIYGAAFTCLCAAAQGQEFSVTKLVRDVAQKAESATQYEFEGDLMLGRQRGSTPGVVVAQAKVHLAAGPGGKSLLRVDAPDKGEYLSISDGQKSWAYVPKLKQYTEEESSVRADGDDADDDSAARSAAAADVESDPAEIYARQVLPILARLYKTAASVSRAGQAEVKFEKKKQKWPVVQVVTKRDAQQGSSMTSLTVDPETMNIGRLVWTNLTYPNGQKSVVQLTVDFHSFQIGAAVPDSTFAFEPPKNAKLVEVLPIPGQTGSALLNHPAPDFELKTLDGDRIRLQDLRGKPVLLTFFASWCGPCRRELPSVVKLHEEFKDKGLQVFGVNDEGKGTARHFAEKAGLTFAVLDDSSAKAHRLYRVRAIPAAFLIDRDGKVVRYLRGGRDYDSLRSALKVVGM